MSAGKGFARRVTLANLPLFTPLLNVGRTASEEGDSGEDAAEAVTDVANQDLAADPELKAAEALFDGKSIRTGVSFSRATRGRSGKTVESIVRRRPGKSRDTSPASEEVLLMRVRPRRTGTQLQISMIVHSSEFMNNVSEVVSAASKSRRSIGYDYVRVRGMRRRIKNTARFEAPELAGIANPVARFAWVDVGSRNNRERILQYEVFDADQTRIGRKILKTLKKGIATPPTTNLAKLSRVETVLSKSDRAMAQWYRLSVQA